MKKEKQLSSLRRDKKGRRFSTTEHYENIEVHLDCKFVIDTVTWIKESSPSLKHYQVDHADVLCSSAAILQKYPTIHLLHVKAHTADNGNDELPLPVLANRCCNQQAKATLQAPDKPF